MELPLARFIGIYYIHSMLNCVISFKYKLKNNKTKENIHLNKLLIKRNFIYYIKTIPCLFK